MASRRCIQCETCWPSDSMFGTCYDCGAATYWTNVHEPDFNKKEGMRRKRHYDFERMYEKRGEQELPEAMKLEVAEAVERAKRNAVPLMTTAQQIAALPTTE